MPGMAALVQVISEQEDMHGERQTYRSTHRGEVDETANMRTLRYTEEDEAGGRCDVQLTAAGGIVRLSRRGESASQLFLAPGERHSSLYETPYGTMELDVQTHEASWAAQGNSSCILLRYDVYLQGELLSKNRITVTYRVKR